MNRRWLGDERGSLAAERILDAAGTLFAERGVAATGMNDVARAAGCSRATLYRYFDSRRALQRAFVNREAHRIARAVAVEVAEIDNPADRLVEAMVAVLRTVRSDRTLAAWFAESEAGHAAGLARTSEVIEDLAAGFVGTSADPDVRARSAWVVRTIVSLLSVPGDDEGDERAMLERFVVPVVVVATSTAPTQA